jgi:hypothetical protein
MLHEFARGSEYNGLVTPGDAGRDTPLITQICL